MRQVWRNRSREVSRPNWRPLEIFLGADELCVHFMWMEEIVLEDETSLHVYKHRWTRRHLPLAEDARTFYWADDGWYRRVDAYVVISEVFDGWENIKPTDSERLALQLRASAWLGLAGSCASGSRNRGVTKPGPGGRLDIRGSSSLWV